jgi:hypothetical protein
VCDGLNTDPALKAILTNGMLSWLTNTPFDQTGVPTDYTGLLSDQQKIGWYQLFAARMANQWSALQDKFLKSHTIRNKRYTGSRWTQSICSAIISSWLELWTQRNASRHGTDTTQQAKIQQEQAVREITLLYSYQDSVLQRDRDIFARELSYHTNASTHYIRQWINTNQAAILHSIKQAKLIASINTRPITLYFTRSEPEHH